VRLLECREFVFSIWVGVEVKDSYNSVQVDGPIDMGEQISLRDAWRRNSFGGRFPLQVRGKERGIDHKQDETSLSRVILFSDRHNLRFRRAMDKALCFQTLGSIVAALLGIIPGCA
jgi:hypothetical protein